METLTEVGDGFSSIENPVITVSFKKLEICSSFKYLGNIVANDAVKNLKIKTRICQAKKAFTKLFQSVLTDKSMIFFSKSPQTKHQFYKSSYKTVTFKTKITTFKKKKLKILIQDCENWHCKKTHFRKLKGCQYRL